MNKKVLIAIVLIIGLVGSMVMQTYALEQNRLGQALMESEPAIKNCLDSFFEAREMVLGEDFDKSALNKAFSQLSDNAQALVTYESKRVVALERL